MLKHGAKAAAGFFEGGIKLGIGSTARNAVRDTRVAKAVAANRGKIILGAAGIAAARGVMGRTGPAADKPRGRPTGPYMY